MILTPEEIYYSLDISFHQKAFTTILCRHKWLAEERRQVILSAIAAGFHHLNPLSANATKWSNTLKKFVSVCLTILWSWRLKGKISDTPCGGFELVQNLNSDNHYTMAPLKTTQDHPLYKDSKHSH